MLVSAYTSIGAGEPIATVFFTQEGGIYMYVVWGGWVAEMINNYYRGGGVCVCVCMCVHVTYISIQKIIG